VKLSDPAGPSQIVRSWDTWESGIEKAREGMPTEEKKKQKLKTHIFEPQEIHALYLDVSPF